MRIILEKINPTKRFKRLVGLKNRTYLGPLRPPRFSVFPPL